MSDVPSPHETVPPPAGPAHALEMRGISKRFGTLQALDGVDLTVGRGEVLALLGENGAGKTTLMRIATGLMPRDEGTIDLDGETVPIASAHEALERGIAMVHQHFMLVGNLTVAENIVLGSRRSPIRPMSKRAAVRETEEVAERHGMRLDTGRRIDQLGVDERAKAEIVKALYLGARILILDEPTSSLGPKQIDELFSVVRSIAADGISVLLVTHRLSEITEIASHVLVLRHGKVTAFGATHEFTGADLARAMIGRELLPRAIVPSDAPRDTPRLRVENLVVRSGGRVMLDNVSFTAHPGRILGIVGVEGNGQAELLEALGGLRAPESGRVLLDDEDVTTLGPRALHRRGIIMISGDRHRWDIVPSMSVTENVGLHRIAHGDYRGNGGMISWKTVEADAARLVEQYDVRPPRTDVRLEQMSGGNQQKVVIARAMEMRPRVLVLGHPTRGLDIGARRFIYDQVVAARDAGVAVILLSFDLEELLEHSDDVLVLFRGAISHEGLKADSSIETVGNAMTGVGGAAAGEAGP